MKILLVTYHFPPDRSVCGDRPYSLFRHAPENGVEMEVLTVGNHGSLPGERGVYRFDSITGWNAIFQPGKWAYKGLTKAVEPFAANIDYYWKKRISSSDLARRSRHYDAIYAIYPTYTDLLVAADLSRRMDTPLIVDFTDSLYTEALEDNYGFWQTRHRLTLEKRLVGHAVLCFSVADRLTQHLQEKYPAGSIETVYNGFEPDDFEGLEGLPRKAKDGFFRVAHFGSINHSRSRSVKPLWEALARLRDQGEISPRNFELVFFGFSTPEEVREVEAFGLSGLVRFHGHVEKRAGFRRLWQTCDALLNYGIPGHRFTVTSKLLEYFRLGLPIIGISRGNEAEALIQATGTGEVCGFQRDEIGDLFLKAIRGRLAFNPNPESIRRFDREEQARRIFQMTRKAIEYGG